MVVKKLYIAETDESGEIACIWIGGRRKSSARVFDPKRHKYDPREPAAFHGRPEKSMKLHLAALMARASSDEQDTV